MSAIIDLGDLFFLTPEIQHTQGSELGWHGGYLIRVTRFGEGCPLLIVDTLTVFSVLCMR